MDDGVSKIEQYNNTSPVSHGIQLLGSQTIETKPINPWATLTILSIFLSKTFFPTTKIKLNSCLYLRRWCSTSGVCAHGISVDTNLRKLPEWDLLQNSWDAEETRRPSPEENSMMVRNSAASPVAESGHSIYQFGVPGKPKPKGRCTTLPQGWKSFQGGSAESNL